ncbi:LuxR family two component transcriptional regulator [Microbacterium sp. AG238]|nr:LuxR family two component transcriptional regulator [Microbacterium sp. AG238]
MLVVDDQELLRRGLRMILETDSGVEVVGEAEDGSRALALIPTVRPDIVLADARMPVLDGLGLVRECAVHHPGLPVLALTTFDDAELVRSLLEAGVAGFLLKDVSADRLLDSIRQVVDGGLVIDPRVARVALSRHGGAAPPLSPELTQTEQAVADLLALGLPNAEIATRLHLAHGTVKNAVSALLRKLGHSDRTSLALELARGR